jgi:hypothetical protein
METPISDELNILAKDSEQYAMILKTVDLSLF